ncbi:hypothetical protein [Uliginosibacterium gangwonense]|uniref:hypothetical protein n=1 Tax=Uliginosibacterium gangwonense TaxID=392736 RepID=UPI00037FB457|nr:hypothetical protein [Uliginosibacterium gangwonense]
MKEFYSWLQKNTGINIVVFLISACSSVVTIVLGWNQFYQDYLSKSINIPIWVFIISPFIYLLLRPIYKQLYSPSKSLKKVEGKQFGVQQINIDGMSFERCKFDHSLLIFEGVNNFEIMSCAFTPAPKIAFNSHAQLTLRALSDLYKDPVFRPQVEATLINIKTGDHPIITPSTPLT